MQVIPELSTGGAERTAIEIAEAVTKAGGLSFIGSKGGRLEAELAKSGTTLLRFAAATKNPLRIIGNADLLTDMVHEHGVDLVHARSRAPAWSAYIASRRLGLPFVTTYHGIYQENGPLKRWYNRIMARGDAVIANSHYTARIIHERYAPPPERVHIIHRGVDLAVFNPDAVEPHRVEALRRAWGVDAGHKLIFYPARLTRWKGHAAFIEAIASIKGTPELNGVTFIIAGDAQGRVDYENEIKALIEASGLSNSVRLTGHCADMPAAFKAAHFTIAYPSEPEAFGRVSAEAQAMGCPVIAADIGALAETLKTDDLPSGWLVAPNDPARLADTMLYALRLSDDSVRAVRGAAAAFSRATFSIDRMQFKTLQIYDALLQTGLAGNFRNREVSPRA